MLDSSRRITAVADYDAYGEVNRVPMQVGSAHPYVYGAPGETTTLATLNPGTAPGFQVKMRALFGVVDIQSSVSGCGSASYDAVAELRDSASSARLASVAGSEMGRMWTGWFSAPSGKAKVVFVNNGAVSVDESNCQILSTPLSGISLAGFEYRRYQTGASAFLTPLRFPGQYYDPETDLHENWNRYYDPSIGRYLQPEPVLQNLKAVVAFAMQGVQLTPYAYAANNPIAFYDADGKFPKRFDKMYGYGKRFWRWAHKRLNEGGKKCKGEQISKEDADELHREWKELGEPGPDGGKWYEDVFDLLPTPPIINPCLVNPDWCGRGRSGGPIAGPGNGWSGP